MIDKNLHNFFQKGFKHLDSFVETGLGPYHCGLKYCILGTVFFDHKSHNPQVAKQAEIDESRHDFTYFSSIEIHQDYIDKAKTFWKHENSKDGASSQISKHNSLKGFKIVKGDSGVILEDTLNDLSRPSIIYLDAHAHLFENDDHDDSPLLKELEAIKRHIKKSGQKEYLIVVDDAGHIAYPAGKEFWGARSGTVNEIKKTLQDIFEAPDETVVVDIDYAENIIEKKHSAKKQPHALVAGGKRNFHLCTYLKSTYKEDKQ